MSSIGVFREEEFSGKPFHIFDFSFLTEPDLSLQPLFLCPSTRRKLEMLKQEENGYSEDDVLPGSTSPHFPDIRSCDQQVQDLFDPDTTDSGICKLPLTFVRCSDPYYYYCKVCSETEISAHGYYFCVTCEFKSHRRCVEVPLEIKHPSYPFLYLRLYTSPRSNVLDWMCTSCEYHLRDFFYYSPAYNFKLHPSCAMQSVPIFIDHLKRHPHSLTFFPKQNSLLCNVCGVIKDFIPTYICARCVFVVHQDCIDFPYVIRICRHHHRISFSYSLPSGNLSCGVCRQKVDNDCGAYHCSKCDDYFVHSRCALRKDLWDGEELEGVPEEPEIVVEPFRKIDEGIIHHISHDHHLKLEITRVYDDEKYCQGCMLPIYEGNYYSCMDQCDFILHEGCADSPLKKYHPLYARSLKLKVVNNEGRWRNGEFRCTACRRWSGGFTYEDSSGNHEHYLDLRCASVSEPFEYEGHVHPLFLALSPDGEESAICQICQDTGASYDSCRKLNCIECEYIICFKCATLPYKARYKHDKHVLTFREGNETSDQLGWCEVCERKMVYSREKGFYTCDDYCCTTLHVDCLLGRDPYMKPGHTLYVNDEKIHILRNNTISTNLLW